MDSMKVINTKDNKECLIINIDGKEKALGSKYNFSNDLNKLTKNIGESDINIETTIIILGLYNGEYLEILKKYLSKTNRVIIFEFNKEIYLKYAKKNIIDFELYLYNENFNLDEVHIESKNIKVFDFGNYSKVYKKECIKIYNYFRNTILSIKLEENTLKAFSKIWFKCNMENLFEMFKSDNLYSFQDKFKNYPAVIVSAGPSLEKNIKQLKELQNKVVIISGGRTLKALLENGINPTFVCVVDPGEGSYKVIRNCLNCDIPLVVNESSNSNVVKEYKGSKIFYNNSSVIKFSEYFFKNYTRIFLAAGGSVAHSSTDLARYMGCNKIIFIGQDLSYTNNKKHADLANISAINSKENYDLMIDDIYGNKIGTSYALNDFKLYFEKYIKFYEDKISFINATEGGANIKGTKIQTLKEVIESLKDSKEIPSFKVNTSFYNIDKNEIKSKCEILVNNLIKARKMSKEILKLNDEFLKTSKINRKNIDGYIVKIGTKEKKLLQYLSSLKVVSIVFESIIQIVTKSTLYVPKKDSSFEDRIKLNYLQTKALYLEVVENSDYCIQVINETLNENL